MSRTLTLEPPDGSNDEPRPLAPSEFPLSVGGPDADIAMPGATAGEPAAWLGLSEGELFIQATDGAATCNGSPVTASQWLRDGDRIRVADGAIRIHSTDDALRLVVESGDDDETTAPPQLVAATASVSIAPPSGDQSTIAPVEFRPAGAGKETRPASPRRRLSTVAVWILVVLLGSVAWILFTVRPVEVRIEPVPDEVRFEGALIDWIVGGRHILRTGSYTLVATKTGYRPLEVPVEISRETSQTLRFTLERLPGLLVLDTGGVDGAEVVIDGDPVGTTPVEPIELVTGTHTVQVRAERHETFSTEVAIEGGGKTRTLDVALVPRWAAVRIESTPSGAGVTIDGERVGTTPVVTDLLEGRHRLRLSLSGYKAEERRIAVTANQPLTVPRVILDPADARLIVESTPTDATVTIDGTFQGSTPADLFLDPGTDYEVTVSKAGHDPVSRTVKIDSGETSRIRLELVPRKGTLEIAAWPPDAELLVNGRSLGSAESRTLELEAVPHDLEIRKEGYDTYRTRVTPRPGLPQSIRVTLQTPEEIFEATTPKVIHTVQGQEMRLIDGGRFTMGAPRREPGRRSNEVEHEVEITRPFYIATTEVSNRQFREFVTAHLSGRVGDFSLEMDHHPVVRIGWDEAAAYCNWLSKQDGLPFAYVKSGDHMVPVQPMNQGYRLPTEAEWALVARYPDGNDPRKYPWGEALPVEPNSGNYADSSSLIVLTSALPDYEDDYPVTAPVDAFRPNPLGLFNLGGNVSEWIHDFYAINADEKGLDVDPTGPKSGDFHVIRGSSWMDATVTELRLSYRDYGADPRPDVGFRVARFARAPEPEEEGTSE